MTEKIIEKLNAPQGAEEAKAPEQQFGIQRLYVKEKSCKINNTPHLFKQEWKPEISMEVQMNNNSLEDDAHEVVLQINVTAKNNHITAFTAEVQQAGIFTVKGFTDEQIKQILMTHAPNTLFPYARKLISDMSIEGTLAPILLTPIDFAAVYFQQQQKENMQNDKETIVDTTEQGSTNIH